MARYDYRKGKLFKDYSFYVVDDLRAWQKGNETNIYYYDDDATALQKFKEMPAGMTTALGVSYKDVHELDLVQKNRNEPFLVTDYLKVDFLKGLTPWLEGIINAIKRELHLEYKNEYELFGKLPASVLIPIDEGKPDYSYTKNKYLRPQNEKYPHSAIKEYYCEGEGWLSYEEMKKAAEIIYGDNEGNKKPRITKLSVDYIEKDPFFGDVKNAGTMDISIAGYRHLLDKSLGKVKDNPALDEKIKKAKEKHDENQLNFSFEKEEGGKER